MPESTPDTLQVSSRVSIPLEEIVWTAIRAQGSGGQNVNKVSSAIHLRFDIPRSSLPDDYKSRMLASGDSRITKDGVVVIKSQNHRTQERNLADGLERLKSIVQAAGQIQPKRRATKPTRGSVQRRLTGKSRKAKVKANRRPVSHDD